MLIFLHYTSNRLVLLVVHPHKLSPSCSNRLVVVMVIVVVVVVRPKKLSPSCSNRLVVVVVVVRPSKLSPPPVSRARGWREGHPAVGGPEAAGGHRQSPDPPAPGPDPG